ncbi:hypothetical protein ScPMuIL_008521 [Solemya velum]
MAAGSSMDYFENVSTVVRDGIKGHDPVIIGILVALIIGFLTLVYLFFSKNQSRRRGILLLGTCDSGKTALFTKLVYNQEKQTYTSIDVNEGSYQVKNSSRTLKIIDLPGHERIRLQVLEQHRKQSRSTVQKEIKEVAEFLYTVLSDSVISHNALPLLVACNKQDMTFSKGAKVIQTSLEKEMNKLRVTRSAALQGTDETGTHNVYLGKKNKDFAFADLKTHRISFVECSAVPKSGEENLAEVEDWLTKIA